MVLTLIDGFGKFERPSLAFHTFYNLHSFTLGSETAMSVAVTGQGFISKPSERFPRPTILCINSQLSDFVPAFCLTAVRFTIHRYINYMKEE